MEANARSTPHAGKRAQLGGTDRGTRFSSWTPLNHRAGNLQLFEERTNLVLHWFDLWTDRQRKHLLHSLFTRCTKSQLKYCKDLLMETVPVTEADFTSVLPRFLSLYVLSFLSPRDLCSAAQVSWHWRVLAEQDCLWAGRCISRGWFLPYTPVEKEYGAWKSHYVSCVSTLDWLTPREDAERYGTLNRQSTETIEEGEEEEEERRKERRIRQMIRDKLRKEKEHSMRTRKPWGSYTKPQGGGRDQTRRPNSGITSVSLPALSWPQRTLRSPSVCLSLDREQPLAATQSLQRVQTSNPHSERLSKASGALSSFTARPPLPQVTPPTLLLLISNRTPAYELVLSGVKDGVVVVLYDHRGTLPALLAQVERTLSGQRAQRLGLLAPGGTEEVHLLLGCSLSERTLLTPDHKGFWEKLGGWVAPTGEGGGIDIFCALAASASGIALMQTLSALTGLEVLAPMGFAAGSFQNILSEWSDGAVHTGLSEQQPASPARQFVCESVLQGWCRQAQWMEEALGELRDCRGPQLQSVSLQARGRALGHFLWEKISLEELCVSKDLSEALTEGLTALTTQGETRTLEFLARFLIRWSDEKEMEGEETRGGGKGENKGLEDFSFALHDSNKCVGLVLELPQMVFDWRGAAARELHHSECLYLGRLGSVLKVYQEPLTAALNSNRAILGYADIHIVLSPVTRVLELNRVFHADLQARLQQWGAEQCVGDVLVKLCSKLRVYTNYLNNYTTALITIDRCRETKPLFRAFLKRADRTLATHMLSLQELLLCPAWRIQEYVTLLQVLSSHTHINHPDHTHLCSALNTLLAFREFIQKLKRNSERDSVMEETQQMIQGCPSLSEGNRQLIITQDAALLRSSDEQIPESLRTYEQVSDVGLFLFNDVLLLTRRNVRHTPFALAHRSTHTFLASVALCSLAVRGLIHTRYVRHAFVLEGPSRSWVCATERGEERERFLSVLRSAMNSALTQHK
ncbi:epithelial cell-transforming sequence 2 oncogene-like isoform X1 [Gasterosteus aculeatus]